MKTVALADGREVPQAAVDALIELDKRWPGATLPQARPAIVAAILDTVFPVREVQHCPGGCDCSCCYGYPDRDCHCFADPCNCGGTRKDHGQKPLPELT